jgi:hypothetical protein
MEIFMSFLSKYGVKIDCIVGGGTSADSTVFERNSRGFSKIERGGKKWI